MMWEWRWRREWLGGEVVMKCIQRVVVVLMECGCLGFSRWFSQNGLCELERVIISPISDSVPSISMGG